MGMMMMVEPRTIPEVAKVEMKGGSRSRPMRSPLNPPMTMEVTRPSPTMSQTFVSVIMEAPTIV